MSDKKSIAPCTYWNKEGYDQLIADMKTAYNQYMDWWNNELNTAWVNSAIDYKDIDGKMASGKQKYKEAVSKLNNLIRALELYGEEYEQMVSKNESEVEALGGVESLYATFGTLTAAGMSDIYNNSVALYYGNQYSFSEYFNDLPSFQDSLRWKTIETMTGFSYFSDYKKYIVSYLGGDMDKYYEKMLENSLYGLMKGIPGYQELDAESVQIIDWDSLGIEGLGDLMDKLKRILNGASGTFTEEELTEVLAEIRKVLSKIDGGEELFQFFGSKIFKFDELLGNISTGVGFAGDLAEGVDFFMNLFYHGLSNHTQQIEWLDTMAESLELAGYSGTMVTAKIAEIKELYLDKEKYYFDQILDAGYDKIEGGLLDLVNHIPGIEKVAYTVDTVFEFVGNTATDVAEDEIAAMEALWGMQAYNNNLVDAYEHHIDMIKSGIATAEDVERADKLFEILRVSKMQEYENMMTIAEGSSWYDELKVKYDELKAMDPDILKIQQSGVTYAYVGGGGGGGGGSGRF